MGILLTVLVIKPLSFFKLICVVCVKTAVIVINTWVELIVAGISLNVAVFSRLVLSTLAFVSFPIRIITAVRRERRLVAYLKYSEVELECLLWQYKEVEARLHRAIKERKMMEMLLFELEEENEQAIARLEHVEDELRALKTENLRLKEIQGKYSWNFNSQSPEQGKMPATHDGSYVQSLQDLVVGEKKNVDALLDLLANSNDIKAITSSGSEHSWVLDQQREVALKRSLFSAILSFLVGMIMWEAKDPCMPLVMALFTVVGMSLISVVQFFSTIRNKPASDAVALLSLNWFVLGTLTYPTLPKVARMVTPACLSFLNKTVRWFS